MAKATTENDVVIGGPDVSGVQNDGKTNTEEGAAVKKEGAADDDQKPTTKKVKIGATEFELPADVADALTGQMEEMNSIVEEIRATTQTKAAPVKEETQNDEYDFSTGIFVEPGVALQKLTDKIKTEIRAEYQQAQDTEKLWSKFYTDNKDLSGMELIVGAVFNKNYSALKDMQADKAMSKLATLVREEALKLGVGKKEKAGGSGNEPDRTTVEGASAPAVKNSSSQKQTDEVPSLSAIIRQRQEARRKAANH